MQLAPIALVLTLLAMPALAQSGRSAPSKAEMDQLLDAARKTAQATRQSADDIRVVPDILTQILAKLDKLENKLDKIENKLERR